MQRTFACVALALAMLSTSTLALADCLLFCGSYAKTKYPIVLVHGADGFDHLGPFNYFYGIPSALTDAGASVYVPQVSAVNTTDVRGEQLLAQVEEIVAISGKQKVNLIGHSHGGPTARYVAGVRPDLVASVTSVAGPNKGGNQSGNTGSDLYYNFSDALAVILAILTTGPLEQDTQAMQASLSTAGMLELNTRFPGGVPPTACGEGAPAAGGIRYYSWSGDASATGQFTSALDISDAVMSFTARAFNGAANDGLVTTCSSHLGTVIRDNYFQNHLDEINQLFGLVNPFSANPKSLFREQANRLKKAGL